MTDKAVVDFVAKVRGFSSRASQIVEDFRLVKADSPQAITRAQGLISSYAHRTAILQETADAAAWMADYGRALVSPTEPAGPQIPAAEERLAQHDARRGALEAELAALRARAALEAS